MAKRGGGLTGGTGDVNPQWLGTGDLTFTGTTPVNSVIAIAIPLPIQRLNQAGKAQVLEVLKVMWRMSIPFNAASLGLNNWGGNAYLTTSQLLADIDAINAPKTGKCIDFETEFLSIYQSHITPDTIVVQSDDRPVTHDLTDGAGHGVLVGTDVIYLNLWVPTGFTNISTAVQARILYRFKDVSLAEYIGIVQSQQ